MLEGFPENAAAGAGQFGTEADGQRGFLPTVPRLTSSPPSAFRLPADAGKDGDSYS